MSGIIEELAALLSDRKLNPKEGSYTTHLLTTGEDEIVKKVGEEAVEVILAAKGQGSQRLVEESADLVYHLLVLLISRDLSWEDVLEELGKRRS